LQEGACIVTLDCARITETVGRLNCITGSVGQIVLMLKDKTNAVELVSVVILSSVERWT
jgi:hypothetical protein